MFSSEIQLDVVIGRSYKLTKKLGSGSFAEIFHGINLKTNMEVAVKLEPVKTNHPQLFYEGKLYDQLLKGQLSIDKGITNVSHCATEAIYINNVSEYNLMVMVLLGPSLEFLFNLCAISYTEISSQKTFQQALERVLTKFTSLILDCQKDTFKRMENIFLIKRVKIQQKLNIMLLLMYIYDQNKEEGMIWNHWVIPWQNKKTYKMNACEKKQEKKIATSIETLYKGFPQELATYLIYVKNLKFDEKPDYDYLRTLLKDLFIKSGFKMDYIYDWNQIQKQKEDPHKIQMHKNKQS